MNEYGVEHSRAMTSSSPPFSSVNVRQRRVLPSKTGNLFAFRYSCVDSKYVCKRTPFRSFSSSSENKPKRKLSSEVAACSIVGLFRSHCSARTDRAEHVKEVHQILIIMSRVHCSSLPSILLSITVLVAWTGIGQALQLSSRRRQSFFKRRYRHENNIGEAEAAISLKRHELLHRITQGGSNNQVPFLFSTRKKQQPEYGARQARESPLFSSSLYTESPCITNVHQLRQKVLDEGVEFRKVQLAPNSFGNTTTTSMEQQQHQVLQLLAERFHSGSTPGNRAANDTARLALSMEGGGMRGAVSAGMACCLAALGLCDALDVIYGSSAGSVIGAYMVSRQMVCMDVYVGILPAAKRSFVCVRRMLSSILVTAVDGILSKVLPRRSPWFLRLAPAPGMNISFVLDGIMDEQNGVRPLDLDTFRENNERQPLRVASSYVKDGQLLTKSFGTDDFSSGNTTTTRRDYQKSLFSCLRASMTVPGATGPPVQIEQHSRTLPFFDAFCFEPIPYRSAVEEGATHCLVFCSRPADFVPKSKPGAYEKAVAPLYFCSHGEPAVAKFFESGGQQYTYAEDLLTLEEGKQGPEDGVKVPPPTVLYGVERDEERERLAKQRDDWKSAHLFPLKVPAGTPELKTLEQDRDTVLEGVRGGFATAFDVLAPVIGLDVGKTTGSDVAKMLFPDDCLMDGSILEDRLHVRGEKIKDLSAHQSPDELSQSIQSLWSSCDGSSKSVQPSDEKLSATTAEKSTTNFSDDQLREWILRMLPGFRAGRMSYLAASLRTG